MTTVRRKGAIIPLATAAIVSLLAIIGWLIVQEGDSKPNASFSVQGYPTIEELADASDAVVIGTVKGVVGREIDYGNSNPNEIFGTGLSVLFYEVDVTKTLRGETDKTIIVSTLDPTQISTDQVTALRDGEELLLFLDWVTSEEAPVLKSYGYAYTPMSLDLGVFDVLAGDYVQSRMPNGLWEEPAATFSMTEFCERIQVN